MGGCECLRVQDRITILEDQVKALEAENAALKARLLAVQGSSTDIKRIKPDMVKPKLSAESAKIGKLLSFAYATYIYSLPPLSPEVSYPSKSVRVLGFLLPVMSAFIVIPFLICFPRPGTPSDLIIIHLFLQESAALDVFCLQISPALEFMR